MNSEQQPQSEQRLPDELLRLACEGGSQDAATPELQKRLAEYNAIRAEFEETGKMLGDLRKALEPQPLPEALTARIRREFDARTQRSPVVLLHPFRVAGLAAAAALILAFLGPLNLPGISSSAPEPGAITETDAAAILSVFSAVDWSSYMDYSMQQVTSDLDVIGQRINREQESSSYLPWSLEEDWDVALGEPGAMSPPARTPVCRTILNKHELVNSYSVKSAVRARKAECGTCGQSQQPYLAG
ncbi:MAG: hypothetical protein ABIG44_08145 [Planctomycetota bacterium]